MNTSNIIDLKNKIIDGYTITKEEALSLCDAPLETLCKSADELREHFCKDAFDICTIVNGKCGKCSENCKFCAQSAFYTTHTDSYPLLDKEELLKHAIYNDERGVLRYSIVTSGRALNDAEVDQVCEATREIYKRTNLSVCVSAGLLNEAQYRRLKEAGINRVHNNLETSRRNFPNVCTTHTYEDKIAAIKAAQRAGMNVCSGGIMGLGETMDDRIDMAFTLRELGVHSVPINILNPIPGTPFEHNKVLTEDEIRRIVAIYRFILPNSSIRLAGGRGLLEDKGKILFKSGANAAISGDMLTTSGITIEKDMNMLKELGYKAVLWNE